MQIKYGVQATVVDLRHDIPRPEDVFWVDTNVWFWMTYQRASLSASPPMRYQMRDYPTYLRKARSVKSKLHHSGLSFAELAHLIEKVERETFIQTHGSITPKEFRHNLSTERVAVAAEVRTAWELVKNLSTPIDVTVNQATTDAALTRFETQLLDGYDLFIVESLSKISVNQVITDDGDYVTIPNIVVFTANRNAIQEAQAQGKLVIR